MKQQQVIVTPAVVTRLKIVEFREKYRCEESGVGKGMGLVSVKLHVLIILQLGKITNHYTHTKVGVMGT